MFKSSLNKKIGNQEKTYTSCLSAEMRTLVTFWLYVCPYFRSLKIKKSEMQEALVHIWSQTRKSVVEKLNPSVDCKNLHCIRHKTNIELEELSKAKEKK